MLTSRCALDQMLAILRTDTPVAFFRLMNELGSIKVNVQVDGERFSIYGRGTALVVDESQSDCQVFISTGRRTIIALIDGEKSMLGAILSRDLSIRADASLLGPVGRAGAAFGDGAIRTRRARGVLAEFRAEPGVPAGGEPQSSRSIM